MSTHPKKNESVQAAPTMDTAEALKLIDQVIAALALTAPMLTAAQRKAATRSRKGMEKVVPTLATLSIEHGVSVPKEPTSEMTSNLALVTQLEAVQQKLMGVTTLVGKNIESARSASWGTATTLYGMLRKAGHRDEQLRSQLVPVAEFFAYRHRAVATTSTSTKGTKATVTAGKSATATATTIDSTATTAPAPEVPSTAPVSASTNAPAAPSNVVVAHTP